MTIRRESQVAALLARVPVAALGVVIAASALQASCNGQMDDDTLTDAGQPDGAGVDADASSTADSPSEDSRADRADGMSYGDGYGKEDAHEDAPISQDGAGATCSIQTAFGPLEPIADLNTAGDNAGVWLMPNQLDGYTQSTRAGGSWQILSTNRASLGAPFSAPVALPALNAATSFDGSPSPRGDGLYILFQSNRGGNDQIWSASSASTSADFDAPTAVTSLASSFDDVSPWLRPDGQVMYFSSNRLGSYGIWRATWNDTDFGAPSLVSEISAAGFSQFPILTPDELVVYWLGGSGMMVASRATTADPFSNIAPVPELAGINSSPDYISPDLCTIYGAARPAGTTYIVRATRSP